MHTGTPSANGLVLIHPHSRKYLHFAFENKLYQFRVLHFSLNTAPQVFTCLRHRVAPYRISSQKTLSYREVSQFMGSLNWASGLIPLGHLHLRPLQHFHSLGLTNRFSTPRRSDPCYLTQAVAEPIVSHIRNPYLTFPGGVHHFHRRLDPGLGRLHGGFSDCGCMD